MKKRKIVLFDIDYTLFDTDTFKDTKLKKYSLYKEIGGVLKQLRKAARLGILSQGDLALQKDKLKKTKIEKLFHTDHMHIVEDKPLSLKTILQKYSEYKVFLVDDNLSVLDEARKIIPSLYAIWIKRGPHAQNQKNIEGFSPNAIIKNLKEIIPIVSPS